MLYKLPSDFKKKKRVKWLKGIGKVTAYLLPDKTEIDVPVYQGVNTIVFGITGSGKSYSYTLPAAKTLLAHVPGMKGVFFEIKNSFVNGCFKAGDKIITFDPESVQDKNSLFKWCMVKEIRQARNSEAEMMKIATFLFGDMLLGANQNLGWIKAARNTLIGVLRVIIDCSLDNTTNWTLVNALRHMKTKEILAYLARHPRNHSLLTKDFSYDVNNPTDYMPTRRAEDIMFFFNQVLEEFAGTFESDGQDTIHDFLHTDGQNLFIMYDLASAEISRSFILYFLKKIKDEKMSHTSNIKAPILFCLDEIDKMSDGGKPADFGLFQAATLGREYGLQILLTTQSIENLYGCAPEFNSHITRGGMAGFPIVLSFRPGDSETIETLQTLYGSKYIEHIEIPMSRCECVRKRYNWEPIVSDTDFAELGTGECYIKIKDCLPQKVQFYI